MSNLLNDDEETRSNVTASSEAENEENDNVHTNRWQEQDENFSSSRPQNNDDSLPSNQELQQQERLLIQLTEAVDKCQAMIRKQRNLLRGFHEMAEDVHRLRQEYEIINAEYRMWKADLERERWMHTQQIRIRMRNNSAPSVERQRSRGSIMLRDLVKNLSTRL